MHVFLLIGAIPFAVLLAGLAVAALGLVTVTLLQFPLIIVAAIAFGAISHKSSKSFKAPGVPCQQP
jgi:hypothetical protein